MLLVYALINKPYILDLRPGNSFVGHLLREGYDVFLLDWGTPGWEDRGTTLDELVGEHLPKAGAHAAGGPATTTPSSATAWAAPSAPCTRRCDPRA